MILGVLFFLNYCFADSIESIDAHRWFLKPNGQKVDVEIDDLHSDTLIASSKADWNWSEMKKQKPKRQVSIAVLDGGVDIEHPEIKDFTLFNPTECLAGNAIPPADHPDADGNTYAGDCAGWNFAGKSNRAEDEDGHGTHVAGIIATILRDYSEHIKILPLKVFAAGEGSKPVPGLAPLAVRFSEAFEYAIAKKVDIIHLSGGWPKEIISSRLEKAVTTAVAQGIAIIVASGNSSQSANIWPCRMDGVICVGALRADGSVARFSNFGQHVDFYAPGEKILSAIPKAVFPLHFSRQGYDYKNGTSQAAPILSAVFAYLLGVDPQATRDEVLAQLVLSADSAPEGKGLHGLFHLNRISRIQSGVLVPVVKGLTEIAVSQQRSFSFEFGVRNLSKVPSKAETSNLSCEGAKLSTPNSSLGVIQGGDKSLIKISGELIDSNSKSIECHLGLQGRDYPFILKVIRPLPNPDITVSIKSTLPLVFPRQSGASSRMVTVPSVNNTLPQPIYTLAGLKAVTVFYKDKILGELATAENCNHLRLIQVDLNRDGKNDLIKESMCDKKFLTLEFFDDKLAVLFPPAVYEPQLTTLNYQVLKFILVNPNLPPSLEFVNSGFLPESENPWERGEGLKLERHLYRVDPELKEGKYYYNAKPLENAELWVESLGLRFTPSYQVIHLVGDELLVKIGGKTAWVNVPTQRARWAELDELLWGGDNYDQLWSETVSSDPKQAAVFHMMITPYEYRSFVFGGPKLRFTMKNTFDPMIVGLGTQRLNSGYRVYIRSFLNMWIIDYDSSGNQISQTANPVDRFDFIGFQDQNAVVSKAVQGGIPYFIVDGTRISSEHVDIIIGNGSQTSFGLPEKCASQVPVEISGEAYLPLFCAIDKETFEARFIKLQPGLR